MTNWSEAAEASMNSLVEESTLEKLPAWMFVFVFLSLGVTFTIVVTPCVMACRHGNKSKSKDDKEKSPYKPATVVWKRVFVVLLYLALNLFCCLCFSVTLPFLLWKNVSNTSHVVYPRMHSPSPVDNKTTLHSYFESEQHHMLNNAQNDNDNYARALIGCHGSFDYVMKKVWLHRMSDIKRKVSSVQKLNLPGVKEYRSDMDAAKSEFARELARIIKLQSAYVDKLREQFVSNDFAHPMATNYSRVPYMPGLELDMQTRNLVYYLNNTYVFSYSSYFKAVPPSSTDISFGY